MMTRVLIIKEGRFSAYRAGTTRDFLAVCILRLSRLESLLDSRTIAVNI